MKKQSDKDIKLNVENNGELNFKADKKNKNFVPTQAPNNNQISLGSKLLATFIALVFVSGVLFFAYRVVPDYIIGNTDEVVASKSRQKAEESSKSASESLAKLIEDENTRLTFTDQRVAFNFEGFGTINFDLKDNAAPKTVENFIRLVDRDYYDDTIIYRTAERENYNVIIGGDPTGIGSGGETANNQALVDEIWAVAPEYRVDENDPNRTSVLVNEPVFNDPGLYPGYTVENNRAVFPKGLLMMNNSGVSDTGTSQFIITTETTAITPSFTVFGSISDDASFDVIDKIKNETEPQVDEENSERNEGRPDSEIKINSISIL